MTDNATCEITNETDLENTYSVINDMEHETVKTIITDQTREMKVNQKVKDFSIAFAK